MSGVVKRFVISVVIMLLTESVSMPCAQHDVQN